VTSPFLAPSRATDARIGRGKVSGGATYYSLPGVALVSMTTWGANAGTGKDYYHPLFLNAPVVCDQLAVEVSTLEAAVNCRIGLYRADTDWQPVGAPLMDSGDISLATTGVKTYTPGTPVYLAQGRLLSVITTNSAGTAAFRSFRGSTPDLGNISESVGSSPMRSDLRATRVFGALPTPGQAWTISASGSTGMDYVVLLRLSAP